MAELFKALKNSLRSLCPRCGKVGIFEEWGHLREKCPSCGLPLRNREPDSWFFMYMTTAAITGVFLVLFLFIIPAGAFAWRLAACLVSAFIFIVTIPLRKSLSIAVDYAFEKKF